VSERIKPSQSDGWCGKRSRSAGHPMNCGREGSCPHRSSRVQEGGRPQQFACAQDEGAWPCAGWPSRVVSTRCGPPCACVESGSVRQGRVGWRANTSRRTTSWWQQQAERDSQLTTSSELDEMSVRARAQNVAKEERRASGHVSRGAEHHNVERGRTAE